MDKPPRRYAHQKKLTKPDRPRALSWIFTVFHQCRASCPAVSDSCRSLVIHAGLLYVIYYWNLKTNPVGHTWNCVGQWQMTGSNFMHCIFCFKQSYTGTGIWGLGTPHCYKIFCEKIKKFNSYDFFTFWIEFDSPTFKRISSLCGSRELSGGFFRIAIWKEAHCFELVRPDQQLK